MSEINFVVDKEKCVHCGMCAQDCGTKIIEFDKDGFPLIKSGNENHCMKCQHCLAICPVGAISVCGKKPEDSDICDNNLPSDEQVLNLIQHHKSIRSYKPENLDKATL